MPAYPHPYMRTCVHAYTPTYLHTYMPMSVCIYIYIYIYIFTHSLTGAEQPRVGCIGGGSVRKGSYSPLAGLFSGTHQKM